MNTVENQVTDTMYKDNETVVSELNDYLLAISALRQTIKRDEGDDADNKHFFFRGQASNEWDVTPGIFRNNMLPHEAELIRSAFVRNPADFRVLTTDFERLTKLQHYSLPTRLLDVTQNPLVALYFACQSNQEVKETENGPELSQPTDGIVSYKRDYCKGYDDLEVRTLSYLANREIYGDFTLEQLLSELQERYIYTQKTADECRKGNYKSLISIIQTSVYKGYKRDKIEMRGDRAEMSDFPLYLNTVAGGLDRRDQTIGGFSFVVKIYAVPVVEIIG